jgi:hypothetical protein
MWLFGSAGQKGEKSPRKKETCKKSSGMDDHNLCYRVAYPYLDTGLLHHAVKRRVLQIICLKV